MKRLSILLTATFFLLSGIQTLSAKKKKKDSKEPDVHLRVDLDRTILPAGKKGKAVIKVCLEPEEIIRDAANRPSVNVALVLDKSGSMSGEKIAQAKEAAVQAIRRLGTKDLVSIVAYSIRLIPLLRHRRQGMSANLKISYETCERVEERLYTPGSIRELQN